MDVKLPLFFPSTHFVLLVSLGEALEGGTPCVPSLSALFSSRLLILAYWLLVDTGRFELHLSLCKSDAFPIKLPTRVRPSPHFSSRHILSIVLLDYKVKCLFLLAILRMVAKTGFEPVKHTIKYNCCMCLSTTSWTRTNHLSVISRVH